MIYIFLILLLAMAGLLIAYPFITEEGNDELIAMETGGKEQILATLNEIEFDFQTKKLAEDDYRYLKNKFEQAAYHVYRQEEEKELQPQKGEE